MFRTFLGVEDGSVEALQVVLTIKSLFFFYNASNRSMEGMAVCHHPLSCTSLFFLLSEVSSYSNMSPAPAFPCSSHVLVYEGGRIRHQMNSLSFPFTCTIASD